MAKTTINNGDAGTTARAAINNNFTEVYTGQHIHNATAKTTPVENDEMGLIDSAASNVLKKVTWANVKAALKTYFDTLYVAARSFGTAASLDVGDAANNIVQLDGSGRLPAVDGSLLTGISGGGGSQQLPAFTYIAGGGTPEAGQFTTDDASPESTTVIKFGDGLFVINSADIPGCRIILTSGSVSYLFLNNGCGTGGGHTTMSVTHLVTLGTAENWSASSYALSFPGTFLLPVNGDGSSLINVVKNADVGTLVLAPAGNGNALTGITPTQVGLGNVTNDAQVKVTDIGSTFLAPTGDGSGLTNVVKIGDIGTSVLAPNGSGAALTGITPTQVGLTQQTPGAGAGFASQVPYATAYADSAGTIPADTTLLYNSSTFSGGIGVTNYTVNDIIKALKQLGMIAS